ncbi:beta-1,3-glucan-binding protein-like [Onthophagus taurus]|uniref:beta-1,3-glucan-binding protein-like n=1 Tax=Onthophagus taurus TaxID=166361 RepID=UPI0039BDB932
MILSILFLAVLNFQTIYSQYDIPRPSIEILHPKGFILRVQDNGKIRNFDFHIKINEEFTGRESGTFNRDLNEPTNGFWTFTESKYRLKVGDIIYYWLHAIDKNGLEYFRDIEPYQVTSLPGNNKNKNNGNRGNGNNKNPVYPTYPTRPETEPPIEKETPSTTTTPKPTTPSICNETPTKINNGASTCSGKLIFSEDFNDLDKWQSEVRIAGEPDFEFVTYVNDQDNLYLKDGVCVFHPIFADDKYGNGYVRNALLDLNINCTAFNEYDCKRRPIGSNILPPVFSSRINSKPTFSFLYGKVEIKAKLPKGNWIYPQLYLTPKRFFYGSGYNSGEMRVAYTLGNMNLNNELSGGLILGDDESGRNYAIRKYSKNENWSENFHVFGLEWRPDRVSLSVDGIPYGNIYPPPSGFGDVYKSDSSEKWKQGDVLAPFDQEMIITLGVGVGGHGIPEVEGKPYKNQDAKEMLNFYLNKNTYLQSWQEGNDLKVDYVKVYAL